MVTSFTWHPDGPPPELEEHSKAKLDVLRRYLRAYFDRLGGHPARDEFKLDLIDGFSGGGTFRYRDAVVSGTPLVMLEECQAAKDRLNRDRSKPLRCDFKLHFVDVNTDHTAHLRKVLAERGYCVDGEGSQSTTAHSKTWRTKSLRTFYAGSPEPDAPSFCWTRPGSLK